MLKLDFKKFDGLIPAVIQDNDTKAVLMLGFMNEAAYKKTLKDKKVTFWSRSRKRLWQKGETSGNYLEVISIFADCDNDSLLIMAQPKGPTCHTGEYSCFDIVKDESLEFLRILYDLIKDRKTKMPKNSYTAELFRGGLKKILEKIDEEAGEVIKAAKHESRQRLIEENCDLIYHLLVLFVEKSIDFKDIKKELISRRK